MEVSTKFAERHTQREEGLWPGQIRDLSHLCRISKQISLLRDVGWTESYVSPICGSSSLQPSSRMSHLVSNGPQIWYLCRGPRCVEGTGSVQGQREPARFSGSTQRVASCSYSPPPTPQGPVHRAAGLVCSERLILQSRASTGHTGPSLANSAGLRRTAARWERSEGQGAELLGLHTGRPQTPGLNTIPISSLTLLEIKVSAELVLSEARGRVPPRPLSKRGRAACEPWRHSDLCCYATFFLLCLSGCPPLFFSFRILFI